MGEIIKGKSGYLLEIGGQRYWVEPQGKEVMSNDIVWWSNPDFVIWPAQSKSPRRPIAVFCDGWAYHHSILREDARKRSALLASGKFWVWSVTHEDVKQALLGEDSTDMESPLLRLANHCFAFVSQLMKYHRAYGQPEPMSIVSSKGGDKARRTDLFTSASSD